MNAATDPSTRQARMVVMLSTVARCGSSTGPAQQQGLTLAGLEPSADLRGDDVVRAVAPVCAHLVEVPKVILIRWPRRPVMEGGGRWPQQDYSHGLLT
jgi:hypothetical protein